MRVPGPDGKLPALPSLSWGAYKTYELDPSGAVSEDLVHRLKGTSRYPALVVNPNPPKLPQVHG